jgi:hypothetical protein
MNVSLVVSCIRFSTADDRSPTWREDISDGSGLATGVDRGEILVGKLLFVEA